MLGTAGHIDHGKTALIGALTGVDTDRLPEEKARGITIDLGFAPLDLGETRVGVVDVPGHEALVRTMVAGATGIDMLLLIVAADEGVMPQTREHVAICDLLGIERGIVALTKTDLVDADMQELAAEEVRELLAPTRLAEAAILPVSATTGDGVEALRTALTKLVAETPPRTPRSGPPRLPVDRTFEIRGFGSVATGTLVGDALSVGDAVALYPSGQRGRVRGLQNHGAATERCEPGARCAVNVQGVSLDELRRGLVVSRPDALAPTHTLDVSLHWLDVAPASDDPLAVALLVGTVESRARVAPIGAPLVPGARGYARIHVDGEPVAGAPGRSLHPPRLRPQRTMGGATLRGWHRARRGARRTGVAAIRQLSRRPRGDSLEARSRCEASPGARAARSGLAGNHRRRSSLCETGLAPADVLDSCFGETCRTTDAPSTSPATDACVAARPIACRRSATRLLAAARRLPRGGTAAARHAHGNSLRGSAAGERADGAWPTSPWRTPRRDRRRSCASKATSCAVGPTTVRDPRRRPGGSSSNASLAGLAEAGTRSPVPARPRGAPRGRRPPGSPSAICWPISNARGATRAGSGRPVVRFRLAVEALRERLREHFRSSTTPSIHPPSSRSSARHVTLRCR